MTMWRGPEDCMICQRNPNPHARARVEKAEEGGITEASLHNLHLLIDRHGTPVILVLENHPMDGAVINALWTVDAEGRGPTFRFTGFSWGYGGTGPTALFHALRWLMGDRAPSMEEIARWPMEGEFKKTFSVMFGPGA
jgi:hypothetical protein